MNSNPLTVTDQLGNKILIPFPPQRIVSLVPSQTELLADLGLGDRVVGITKFCVHPNEWRKTKTIIGGTKKFNFDVIRSLKPDLIIGNKEENYREGIEELKKHYPVWVSDIVSLEDAHQMMLGVGDITNTVDKAVVLTERIKNDLTSIVPLKSRNALYLIWKSPWMGVASETFIDEMLRISGLKNCLKDRSRYPEISSEEIKQLNPELILLSSEPYPFSKKHAKELKQLCPDSKILLVDGEMFSWYGSRLLKFNFYVQHLQQLS